MKNTGLQVKLELLDRLTTPLRSVERKLNVTQDTLHGLQADLANVEAWKKQQAAVNQSAQHFADAQRSIGGLEATMRKAGSSSHALNKKLKTSSDELEGMRRESKNAKEAVEKLKQQLDAAKKSGDAPLAPFIENLKKARAEAKKAASSFGELRTKTAAVRRESIAASKDQKESTNAFNTARISSQRLSQQHAIERKKLAALRSGLKGAGIDTRNLSGHSERLKNSIGLLNSKLDDEARKLDRVALRAKNVEKVMSKLHNQQALLANTSFIGNAATSTGRGILQAASAPIGAAANYGQSISQLGAVAIKSTDNEIYAKELKKLDDAARKLGSTTVFSASQAAEGMKFLGMAGFKTQQIITAMPAVLNLASAGATDLGRASDIASDIMGGFNLKADDMGRISDVLTATFTSSNTTLEMLGETMKFVAPEARGVGMSLEQTAAAAGLLANVGIKGSMAGTALRSMISSLSAPGDAAIKVLTKLSIKTKDAKGNLRDFPSLLSEMAKATKGMGSGDRKEAFKIVFGVEAGTAAAELIDKQGVNKAVDKFTKVLVNSAGMAARVAERQNDNAMGSFKQLMSAVESLSISAGNLLLPQMVWLTEKMKSLAVWTQQLVDDYPNLATGIGTVALIVGGLAVAGGVTMTAIAGLGGGAVMVSAGLKLLGINAAFASTGLRAAGLAGIGKKAGVIGLAAGAGYAVGSWLNPYINDAVKYYTDGKHESAGGWIYDANNDKPIQPVRDRQASITDNSQTTLHITQNKGEDSTVFAQRTADLIEQSRKARQQGALYDLPEAVF